VTTLPEQCERARAWASLRVDDELSELQSAVLDSHLRRCRACRAFARGTEQLSATLASARLEQPVQLELVLPPRGRLRALGRTALAAGAVAAASVAATLTGVSVSDGTARVSRPVAMVTAMDTPNELRALRRPLLVVSNRTIPRNRQDPGESF
jgi:predicted anti-sigma-YlaC factor YlaD